MGAGGVDVLGDLRDGHHQADGGRLLGQQGAEIDGDGAHVVQRRVDGGQQGAAAHRVARRVVQAQALADGVVELRRVQPHLRVGQRHAVAHQPGAGDAQRHAGIAVRGVDGPFEQRQQRRRGGQGRVAPADQGLGKGGDAVRVGAGGGQGELRVHGGQGLGHAGGQGGVGLDLRCQPGPVAAASCAGAGAGCPTSRCRCGHRCHSRPSLQARRGREPAWPSGRARCRAPRPAAPPPGRPARRVRAAWRRRPG